MADFGRTQVSSQKVSSFTAKNAFDDVFGGAPTHGIPTLSCRVEDYTDIFSTRNSSSRVSSVPFLDLPVADETDFGNHVWSSSKFDYAEIFGGGLDSVVDYAVPYEELFLQPKSGFPAEIVSPPEESSEDPVCSETNETFSNIQSHYAYDCSKKFNVSYNKTSHVSKEDGISGATHIAKLNAIPAYTCVVDENLPLRTEKCDNSAHEVVNHKTSNGNTVLRMDTEHIRETMPPQLACGSAQEFKKNFNTKGTSDENPFPTLSEVSLKTYPTEVPPPSRQPPKPIIKQGSHRLMSSDLKSSTKYARQSAASPPSFDVDTDSSSSAAASVAAMKQAMEMAQARLKSAKELMERKKDGLQNRKKIEMKDTKGTERSEDIIANDLRHKKENSYLKVQKQESELKDFDTKENILTQASDQEDIVGEWKAEELFFELVKKDTVGKVVSPEHKKSEVNTIPTLSAYEYGKNERSISVQQEENSERLHVTKRVCESVANNKTNEAIEAYDKADHEEKISAAQRVIGQEQHEQKQKASNELKEKRAQKEDEMKLNDTREQKRMQACEQEEHERKTKEVHDQDEHERRLKKTLELEEKMKAALWRNENEKRQSEAHERGEEEKKQKAHERRQKEMHEKEENEKKENERIQEAFEKEENERRQKETREIEENEKRLKESYEREEKETRLKQAAEEEERRLKQVLEMEENQRKQKEVREKEEDEILQQALQREENERKQQEAHEIEEYDKRLKESFERREKERKLKEVAEEDERRLKQVLEMEEIQRRQKDHEREENEKRLIEFHEREENKRKLRQAAEESERRLQEVIEREKNERRRKEEQEREENEKKLTESFEREENELKLKGAAEEDARRLEQVLKMEGDQRKREENGREENEKKLTESFEREENELKLKGGAEEDARRLEQVLKMEGDQRKREENQKRIKLCHEREDNEWKLKQSAEENERTLKQTAEENEMRMPENIDRAHTGEHEREESEKRSKESSEKGDHKWRLKQGTGEKERSVIEVHEQEENENRQKEILGQEDDKRSLKVHAVTEKLLQKETCETAENEKKLRDLPELIKSKVRPEESHKLGEKDEKPEEASGQKDINEHNKASEGEENEQESSLGFRVGNEDENLKTNTVSEEMAECKEKSQAGYDACIQDEIMSPKATCSRKHEATNEKLKVAQGSFENAKDGKLRAANLVQSASDHEKGKDGHIGAFITKVDDSARKLGKSEDSVNGKEDQADFNCKDVKMSTKGFQRVGQCSDDKTKFEAVLLINDEGKRIKPKLANEINTNQERKENNFSGNVAREVGVEGEKILKDREQEKERLRKLEEHKQREREREKDRIAVERVTREARERAFTEARERAERAAVERATAEARQRAMIEARERLEKACAEAREKSLAEKAYAESRLRAERAAVERATAEARERAVEKAIAERAAMEARERVERSASAASRDGELKKTSSFSDTRNTQFQSSSTFNNAQKYPKTSNHGASNEKAHGIEVESAQRCKARLERHQRTVERSVKALAEKNLRDNLAQRELAEKNRLGEILDADVKRWSSGKEGNLRALLSTLQYILGSESGWQPIPLTDIVTAVAVKKAYRKATLCVHPDKLQQRGASIQQKYVCEKVFDLLKDAWSKFNSEER